MTEAHRPRSPSRRSTSVGDPGQLRRKGLVIILDGLGDPPPTGSGDGTPLALARTPFLDRLASGGRCGLTIPLRPGEAVDTPTGTSVLLGVPPAMAESLARGPVEAAGVDLPLRPGDVVIRCNFATLARDGDGFVILDRRAGRIRRGTVQLEASLSDVDLGGGIVASLRAASQHRAVVRLRGGALSDEITDTDPGVSPGQRRVLACHPLDPTNHVAARTAEAVNRFVERSFQILDDHPVNLARRESGRPPANGIILRGPGHVTSLSSIVTDAGLRTTIVAGERTVVGLGRLLGFQVVTRTSFNGLPDTDLDGKVEEARTALEEADLVFLHIKAPDIKAHDRDPEGKRETLERIDEALSRLPPDDLVVAVCGDHCTAATTGRHTADPVPALLWTPGGVADLCATFDEVSCARGSLGRLPAARFVRAVLESMGVQHPIRTDAKTG